MGRSMIFSGNMSMGISHLPRSSSLPLTNPFSSLRLTRDFQHGSVRILSTSFSSMTRLRTKAVMSEDYDQKKQLFRVSGNSTGTVPPAQLLQVVETAAKTGAEVVMEAVNKPRNITCKGLTELITDTEKASEAAIMEVVKKNFSDHFILCEKGLVMDDSSHYRWHIDPLDGTRNFAHGYPGFAVSVSVSYREKPAAAAVVEFVGGPMCWNTRIFSATAGGGALCNGQKIHVSSTDALERALLITGSGYERIDGWSTNMEQLKELPHVSRGVRRLDTAAVDMCHVALGIAESYWDYGLKPWEMLPGVLIVEEAGGAVTRMDGGKLRLLDRSVLLSNGVLHSKLLERIAPATENLGIKISRWLEPEDDDSEEDDDTEL